MHNTGVRPQLSITEKVTFMKVAVQFCLHSIILYYNYFVYNSVDKLLIFFQFEFNKVGEDFFFKNTKVLKESPSFTNTYKQEFFCERDI